MSVVVSPARLICLSIAARRESTISICCGIWFNRTPCVMLWKCNVFSCALKAYPPGLLYRMSRSLLVWLCVWMSLVPTSPSVNGGLEYRNDFCYTLCIPFGELHYGAVVEPGVWSSWSVVRVDYSYLFLPFLFILNDYTKGEAYLAYRHVRVYPLYLQGLFVQSCEGPNPRNGRPCFPSVEESGILVSLPSWICENLEKWALWRSCKILLSTCPWVI